VRNGGASALQRVHRSDPEYRRLAAEEAAYWDQPRPYSLESIELVFADGPIERYVNRRLSGNSERGWWETISDFGTFRRGLVLGTSAMVVEARILEANPGLHLTFVDISPGALARRAEQLGARFPGRVDTLLADLNFLDLPRAAYDLMLSSASLHHVTNLEWLAGQLAAGLEPGGYFFLQDYVGEPRFQFSEAKKRVFEAFHDRFIRRMPGRRPGVLWKDTSDLSPFCGVRSDEVLPVISASLEAIAVHTSSTLLVPLIRASPADGAAPLPCPLPRRVAHAIDDWQRRWRGQLPRLRHNLPVGFLGELFALDEVLCDAAVLLPGVAFGVYRAPSPRRA
jgi:SAM-dependent methyltransferase